jgi:mersacidin/lichenicidin family type 2 lantibiotic
MASEMLIRVWKDEEYRLGLSEADLAGLAANPAGSIELTDAELDVVEGGGRRKKGGISVGNCSASARNRARNSANQNAAAVALSFVVQVAVGSHASNAIVINISQGNS